MIHQPTTLTLMLANPGPDMVTVQRVAFRVALFGMGMPWEDLEPLGPFTLAADPGKTHTITRPWTPTVSGHRCVCATVDLADRQIMARRNLDVIEANAHERLWQRGFHIGNPTPARAPVAIVVGGDQTALDTHLIVDGRHHRPDQPIWLDAGAAVEARLLLHARTPDAISATHTIEVYLGGQFLDGIALMVSRPALVRPGIAVPEPTHEPVPLRKLIAV